MSEQRGTDDAFGHWLAGFIDGEGCFRIQRGLANRRFPYYACAFHLKQRDDDRDLLRSIIARTGIGCLREDRSRSGKSNPCVVWVADSKAHTEALVELLDRYPLRSRKLRDYLIWREAVEYRKKRVRGNRWHGPQDWQPMEIFRARIVETRTYRWR